jgi:hypothetical protein
MRGGWLEVPLGARDSLLDAMAFSRGRFMVEAQGLEPLCTKLARGFARGGGLPAGMMPVDNFAPAGKAANTDSNKMQYKTCCAPQKVINRCKAGWSKAHLAPSFEAERMPTNRHGTHRGLTLGSTARKEVIRCLMVQQRGRQPASRSIIANFDEAIKAPFAALPGR